MVVYTFIHIWIAQKNLSFVFPKLDDDATLFYNNQLPSLGIDFEKITLSSELGHVEACSMPSLSSNNLWVLYLHSTNTLFYSEKNLWRYRVWNNLGLHIFTLNYIAEEDANRTSSSEKMYQSAMVALAFLKDKMGIPEEKILIYGEGLGAYPAVLLAKRNRNLGGLVLENGITGLHDYLQDLYPIVAVRYLFKEPFPIVENIKKVETPTLFIASEKDETYPYRYTKLLYENSPAIVRRQVMLKKNIQQIKNKDAKTYQKALADFLKELKLRVI
ncbi:MAG: hypothetical protein OHK0045_19160 [Raineya sp.]